MIAGPKFPELEFEPITDYTAAPLETLVEPRKRATATRSANWPAGSRAWSTPSPSAGSATTAKPKSCARKCWSRRCKSSTSSKCRPRSVVGCGRSRSGWRSTGKVGGAADRDRAANARSHLHRVDHSARRALTNERAAARQAAQLGEIDEGEELDGPRLARDERRRGAGRHDQAPSCTSRKRLARHLDAVAV